MKRILVTIILIASALTVSAQRKTIDLDADWTFRFGYQFDKRAGIKVQLPHCWNALDGTAGNLYYHRGMGNYTKKVMIPSEWQGKRVFIRFEGANSICDFFLNDKFVGEHRGGYTAFTYDLTDLLKYGEENKLWARVNNSEQLDVLPLVGDFNIGGGLYRDVYFIVTDKTCISPLDFSSPGVYFDQKKVTDKSADVDLRAMLSNSSDTERKVTLRMTVAGSGKTVLTKDQKVTLQPGTDMQEVKISFTMKNPRLWNSRKDPYMYDVTVALVEDGKEIDMVQQHLGLRYYSFDPDKGFFLNGEHLKLRGVCRHQERAEVGNALKPEHHEEDARLMSEMGVNALRGSHYPHATYFYDMMDKYGIVTWAEIPFVGPGGYADKGFVNKESFKENGRQQLRELIHQQYNHPAICVWGLFNELKTAGDDPTEYVKELNDLAHSLDPYRQTTAASNQYGEPMDEVTDNIAFNRYDGWYGSTPKTLATFLDKYHAEHPQARIAISEYGAGASIYHQQDSLKQPVPTAYWHPENWQTFYHIENWKILSERDYVWGSFVWNMFDFGAANRTEGDRPGINDKGLVTRDRKVCKDSYFFYKANWNDEPMVYIADRRCTDRYRPETEVMVFSNAEEVTLRVDGKEIGTMKPDEYRICRFKVTLSEGQNKIEALASGEGFNLSDSCEWTLR